MSTIDRTHGISPRCLIFGGEKIPTFEFICASFGWLGIPFKKKSVGKDQILSGFCPKVKFLSRQVKWDPEGAFLGLLLQNFAYGFL